MRLPAGFDQVMNEHEHDAITRGGHTSSMKKIPLIASQTYPFTAWNVDHMVDETNVHQASGSNKVTGYDSIIDRWLERSARVIVRSEGGCGASAYSSAEKGTDTHLSTIDIARADLDGITNHLHAGCQRYAPHTLAVLHQPGTEHICEQFRCSDRWASRSFEGAQSPVHLEGSCQAVCLLIGDLQGAGQLLQRHARQPHEPVGPRGHRWLTCSRIHAGDELEQVVIGAA